MNERNSEWIKWSCIGLIAMSSYYVYSQMTSSPATSIAVDQQYKQQDIRQNLQFLLHEHGILLNQAILAALKNAPPSVLEAGKTQLLKNSHEIALLLASVYGPQAGQSFETLFNEHISGGAQYINAVKANHSALADQISQKALDNGRQLAKFFSELAPTIPYSTWEEIFEHHVMLEAKQTQAYFQGDFNKANQLKDTSLVQLEEMANLITSAILKQPPSSKL